VPTEPVLDAPSLRICLLAGKSHAQIAAEFDCSTRSVRRAVARAKAAHGDRWPRVPEIAPPVTRADKAEAARDAAVAELTPPPANATPDELEAYAQAVYVAEAQCGGKDRIAAARALVELADKRRGRRPAGDAVPVDPLEAAAAIMLEIERATDNVVTVEKSTDAASIVVADVRGV
jgi:hypothetical protein